MPPVQSFTCPHCEHVIARGQLPDFFAFIPVVTTQKWTVNVLVCPRCTKSLGVYSLPPD
jgi:hypothetical protein